MGFEFLGFKAKKGNKDNEETKKEHIPGTIKPKREYTGDKPLKINEDLGVEIEKKEEDEISG
jgi:hypothetical protein